MKEPLVSIIIPTYGRSEYLKNAIESALAQTYKNIEIIVVDDNGRNSSSQIATNKLMQDYMSNEAIKYIKHNKNKGGAIARNTGVLESKGELITFLDDDDLFLPRKVEAQVNHIKNNNLDLSLCSGDAVDHCKVINKRSSRHPSGVSMEEFLINGCAYTLMMMLKRKLFLEVKGFEDTPRFQDHVFMIKLHEVNAICGVIREKLYVQNIYPGPRISSSSRSRLGYEIKHKFEKRNFKHLTQENIKKVLFRQDLSMLQYNKEDYGYLYIIKKSIALLSEVATISQLKLWVKVSLRVILK